MDVIVTIPGWPLYENPGLNNEITGVISDINSIRNNIPCPVHHQLLPFREYKACVTGTIEIYNHKQNLITI